MIEQHNNCLLRVSAVREIKGKCPLLSGEGDIDEA